MTARITDHPNIINLDRLAYGWVCKRDNRQQPRFLNAGCEATREAISFVLDFQGVLYAENSKQLSFDINVPITNNRRSLEFTLTRSGGRSSARFISRGGCVSRYRVHFRRTNGHTRPN